MRNRQSSYLIGQTGGIEFYIMFGLHLTAHFLPLQSRIQDILAPLLLHLWYLMLSSDTWPLSPLHIYPLKICSGDKNRCVLCCLANKQHLKEGYYKGYL